MPMWIGWTNPHTGKKERIYNYYDPDDPAGRKAIQVTRAALAQRFCARPRISITLANWERIPLFQETKTERTPVVASPR